MKFEYIFCTIVAVVVAFLGFLIYQSQQAFQQNVEHAKAASCDTLFYNVNRHVIDVHHHRSDIDVENADQDAIRQIDSLARLCNQLHSQVLRNQDRIVQDIRQEANNHINRTSAWLSFWLSIMALIAVFLPIALQYFLYRADEKRLSQMERMNQFATAEQNIKILTRGISELYEGHVIGDFSRTKQVVHGTLNQIKEQLNQWSESFDNSDVKLLRFQILSMALIISRSLREFNVAASQDEGYSIQIARDKIRKVINDIADSERQCNKKSLLKDLKRIIDAINAVEF